MSAADDIELGGGSGLWRRRRVLVTGGLGFIGANLCHRLAALGAEIAVLDCSLPESGANPANVVGLEGRIEIHRRDLAEAEGLDDLVVGREVIFNLAARTGHAESMSDPWSDQRSNVVASLRLLEACRRRNTEATVVFASTRQIYGRPRSLPVAESHPLDPPDINAIHKVAGESYHLLYHRVYGLKACALRLTNTFGPRMRIKDARQNFLGLWVRAVLEGRPFEVWGGSQLRDLTYVDDVVEAFVCAARTPACVGRAFNVGGFDAVSLRDLADLVIAANGGGGYAIKDFPAERKAIDIGSFQADDRAFRAATGWQPTVRLPDGLKRTLDYFRPRLEDYCGAP